MRFRFRHSVLVWSLLMAGCSSSSPIQSDEIQRIEEAMRNGNKALIEARSQLYKTSQSSDEQFISSVLDAWLQGQRNQVNDGLSALEQLSPSLASPKARQLYYTTHAQLAQMGHNPILAANSLIHAAEISPPTEQDKQFLNAWHLLLGTPLETLRNGAAQQAGTLFEGWLKLAQWQQQVDQSGAYDVTSLNSWRQAHPDHPAWRYWQPQGSATVVNTQPYGQEWVTISPQAEVGGAIDSLADMSQGGSLYALLPLTGPYANMADAVKRGLQAALGTDSAITFIDTNLIPVSQIAAGLPAGSQVIGPLLKPDVAAFSIAGANVQLWLALNHVEHAQQPNTFFMGLDPTDEVEQMVEQMVVQGHKRVLLLLPDNANGHRYQGLFEQVVSQQNSVLSLTVEWLQQDDTDPARLLALIDPDRRRQQMMLTGQPPQDILPSLFDAVYLDGNPSDVIRVHDYLGLYVDPRATKPVFYLGSKASESGLLPDWDDALTLATPMLTASHGELYRQAANELANPSPDLLRLYALGHDAGALLPQLLGAQSGSGMPNTYDGASGSLAIDPNGTIHRELSWDK
ncbi:penicillin-binding protein activator [Aeromonas caviae]|uniref:Penicillin-binding protein activator n=1 Tax=Aeromonas caviae TaxID=648 RepID=A0AAJ6CT52_AERCA|nr:penicillin-binding protein activator [Aeromonas caviae]WFG00175.1 penicillin-binding protein activator [Aeromonas caviae]